MYTRAVDEEALRDADIDWCGDSLKEVSGWPDEVKANIGFELRAIQRGEKPRHCRHLTGIGTGIWELRDQNKETWFRVAYLPRRNDVVYVLHAFTKKSAQMTASDKATILKRYKEVKSRMEKKG
jgi:phage-related protein